jgi:glyceraldehyde 3-phosphate dehydrogenase
MLLSHAAAKLAASSAAKSTTVARCGFHSSSALEARKFFVGGNWKCNGSVQQVNDLISMLNQSTLSTDTEVVVCPSQLFVQGVKNGLRGDVAVGSQDVWTGGNGAYTGETSADMLAGKLFLSNLLSN